ncbi:MAG: hypothetical protein ACSHYF_11190 [Verrucomicrobiaceae bacterium]
MKPLLLLLLTTPVFAGTYSITIQPTADPAFVELPLPAGTIVKNASHGGSFDAARGILKWGPLLPAPASLNFTLANEPNNSPLNPTAAPASVNATASGPTLADSDGDGLSDNFEALYQFNNGTDESGIDHDGDGLTTLAEALLGTNPRDPSDSLKTLTLERTGNTVTWIVSPALPTFASIEAAASPDAPTWLPLPATFQQNPGSTTITLTQDSPTQKHFYRIRFQKN